MGNDTVIRVEDLAKRYRLGLIGRTALHEDLSRWWARVRGRPDPTMRLDQLQRLEAKKAQASELHDDAEHIWALRDVNFEVKQGEVLGIIGKNGAGKSTLLKILSRVTSPTLGCVKVRGRIASLLEVGTGFHPELTGRENIFLNGAILGMSKAEIRSKFDEIVAFAELDKFIDTPVKRYSSGMYVRLAFAVAAHLEPEILVVDEVLAVGDAAFQKKCLGKMRDVAGEGRTVLFVSHNMGALRRLCTRAILLEQGSLSRQGNADEVVSFYLENAVSANSTIEIAPTQHRNVSMLQIVRLVLHDQQGTPTTVFSETDAIQVDLHVHAEEPITARVGIGIHREGLLLSYTQTDLLTFEPGTVDRVITLTIVENTLLPGVYELHMGAHQDSCGAALDWVRDAAAFRVVGSEKENAQPHNHRSGIVQVPASWNVG